MGAESILILSALIIIFAVITQSITGFGFALISIPLFLFIYSSQQAVVFTMILSCASVSILAFKSRYYIRWRIVSIIFFSSIPGIALGAFWHGSLSTPVIKGAVGSIILLFLLISLYSYLKQRNNGAITTQEYKEKNVIWYYVVGFVSGFLTGLIGMSGPLVVMLLVNVLPRNIYFATSVSFMVIEYLLAIGVYYYLYPAVFDGFMLSFLLWMIPAILIGSFIGQKLKPIINDSLFKKIVYTLLLVIASVSVFDFLTFIF